MARSCREIISEIEKKYPLSLAEEYDNVGLLIGDENKAINKILVCLDINEAVVEEAIINNVDMILSHHPLIFRSLKKILCKNPTSSLITKLIKDDICVYALHTNFDNAENGMNDLLAERLALKDVDKLEHGTGRYGILNSAMTLKELCLYVKEKLAVNTLRVAGDLNSTVNKVAIVGGAGADFIEDAIALGCDVLITGDVKHHSALDAINSNLNVIDAGHYFTEVAALPYFAGLFNSFTDLEILITKVNTNPFKDV